MTLNEKIISDIHTLRNPVILSQIFEFVRLMKRQETVQNTSLHTVRFPKYISDEEAQELHTVLKKEFNHIEGEW